MNILVLGGTVFVGRGIAEAALAKGHRVTLFHRGSHGTGIVPGAEEILGDRDGGLDALEGQTWDAVVDACGYVPRIVDASVNRLWPNVHRYLFVSTISVYEEDGDEGLRVRQAEVRPEIEEITGETYGPLKVRCEEIVQAAFRDRTTIVRPGLVYGPYDPTNRFPYWVDRFMGSDPVLVPDVLNAPLQQVDARDLGRFCVRLLEHDVAGHFDAVGEPSTFGAMIEGCQTIGSGSDAVVIDPEALSRAGIVLGRDLPLAMPDSGPLMKIVPSLALQHGLERRPFRDTLTDTADWIRNLDSAKRSGAGMSREREREAIASLRTL